MSPMYASWLLEPTNPIYSFLVPVRGLPCNLMAPDTYDASEWDFRKARLHCNSQEVGGQCIETGACPEAPSVYFQDFQIVADTWASPFRTREYLCSGNYKLLVADSPKWYGWKKITLCAGRKMRNYSVVHRSDEYISTKSCYFCMYRFISLLSCNC